MRGSPIRRSAGCSTTLQPYADGLPPDSDDACLIRVARRDFEKAVKVPADFVARWSAHSSASYDAWTRARPANDFATMRPLLERSLDFSRQYAGFFAPYAHIADPLIDGPDEGMTTAKVLALFAELRAALVPIVRAIAAQPLADDSCLRGSFPEPAQMAFGTAVIERVGYDFKRGRLDKTHHPFCTKFAAGDVRITTRVRDERPRRGAVLHAARGRPRALRAGRRRRVRGHAPQLGRIGRRAREPVAAVGERGRPQPRLLGAFLSAAAATPFPTSSRACRWRPSTAPSTRWPAR